MFVWFNANYQYNEFGKYVGFYHLVIFDVSVFILKNDQDKILDSFR